MWKRGSIGVVKVAYKRCLKGVEVITFKRCQLLKGGRWKGGDGMLDAIIVGIVVGYVWYVCDLMGKSSMVE